MGWFLSQLESCPQTIQTHSHQSNAMGYHWLKPPPENGIIRLAFTLMLYSFIIHINLSSVVTCKVEFTQQMKQVN